MTDSRTADRHKASHFTWSDDRARAAVLLAENELTDEEIAAQVGVSRRTLARWKDRAEFNARVGDHVGQIQVGMLKLAIAKKHKRLAVLDDLQSRLLKIVTERSEDTDTADVPGGGTGLLVRQTKSIGVGPNTQIIEEYAVDNATARQIMALQEQAAKELGQWVERTATEDLTRIVEIVGVPADAI